MDTATRLAQIIEKHNEIVDLIIKLKKENKVKEERILELEIKNKEFERIIKILYKHHAKNIWTSF